jgi:23S rRNA (uridine2552-2'-O)-methyltransferase
MAGRKSGGRTGGGQKGGNARQLHTKVKTARGRKTSSTQWLQRQLNDPYVAQAKIDGYRSRAAYKLRDLDDKFRFLKPGQHIVDLGAAPGGWSQVAAGRVSSSGAGGQVIAVDILEMDEMADVTIMKLDMREPASTKTVLAAAGGNVDVVLSDLAPSTTGHGPTDHLRIVALVEVALDIALEMLSPGGTFVAKVFKGGAEGEILSSLKANFDTVKHAKPPSSRPESAETYVVALKYRGAAAR